MAILDAWSYRLPVITTPVGGIPDIIMDGINGLIFKQGDIIALSLKMEELINNKKLRDELSKASKSLIENEFSLFEISKELNEIYKSLI